MEKFGNRAWLIHTRNNWMAGVYQRAKDAGVAPESSKEFLMAIEVGELLGEAMRTRLTRIPSDLFGRGYSTEKLKDTLTKLLEDKKKG